MVYIHYGSTQLKRMYFRIAGAHGPQSYPDGHMDPEEHPQPKQKAPNTKKRTPPK